MRALACVHVHERDRARFCAYFCGKAVPAHVSSLPLLNTLGLHPLETSFQHKIAMFVFRCLHNLASVLFNRYFCRGIGGAGDGSRRITRGSDSNLLQVPFLPGPAGRTTMAFFGSVLWNDLPPSTRIAADRKSFKDSLCGL